MSRLEIHLPVSNHSLKECRAAAQHIIASGGTIWQKWTCDACGSRETNETPNVMLPFGKCKCGHTTDITERGCNYRAMKPIK